MMTRVFTWENIITYKIFYELIIGNQIFFLSRFFAKHATLASLHFKPMFLIFTPVWFTHKKKKKQHWSVWQHTIECRNNAIQYSVLYTVLQRLGYDLIWGWTHKWHPIPRPHGRAMGCLLWVFERKLTALYRHRTVMCRYANTLLVCISQPRVAHVHFAIMQCNRVGLCHITIMMNNQIWQRMSAGGVVGGVASVSVLKSATCMHDFPQQCARICSSISEAWSHCLTRCADRHDLIACARMFAESGRHQVLSCLMAYCSLCHTHTI